MTLADLHAVLQISVGWQSMHLHGFNHKGRDIGPVEGDPDNCDERVTELWAVVPTVGEKMRYTYDYGDDWIHEIEVEAVYEADNIVVIPRCLDGRRAGPPEDCGGLTGFEALLRRGSGYDPNSFAAEAVDEKLARVFAPGKVASAGE